MSDDTGVPKKNVVIMIVGTSSVALFDIFVTDNYMQLVVSAVILGGLWLTGPFVRRWMAAAPMQRFLIGAVGVLVVTLAIQAVEHGVDYWNMLIGVAVFVAVTLFAMPWPQDR